MAATSELNRRDAMSAAHGDGGAKSLRLRLFAFLLGLAAVAAVGVGGATYFSVRAEADALFDYQLRQMALSLRDQGRIPDADRAALQSGEFDYVVQVWSVDGVELYSTLPAPPLPPRAVLGYSTAEVAGKRWRSFSAATPLRIVQVAQPLAVRTRLAAAAAGRSVLPIVVAAPLVALAIWWLVGASLAPLARVAGAARERRVDQLAPLPLAGLPSEVTPLVRSFNALLERLDAAFVAQRDFVADAAHELRSPLTALKLQLGLLRGAGDAAERDDAIARLATGIDRAQRLVEQLLALARAEPGAAAPQLPIDLAEVLRAAAADSQALAAARGATITVDAPSTLPWRGDAQSLRSLARNLVDNALLHGGQLDHGGKAPQVALSLTTAEGAAIIRVDDNGPGIPPAERESAFDRFRRRAQGGGAGGGGSGLGLAIVRRVAEQHGGSATLATSPQGGLRAEVRLPPMTAADPAP